MEESSCAPDAKARTKNPSFVVLGCEFNEEISGGKGEGHHGHDVECGVPYPEAINGGEKTEIHQVRQKRHDQRGLLVFLGGLDVAEEMCSVKAGGDQIQY